MAEDAHIPIERPESQRCSISISDHGIDIYFHPALPDGPHKVTRAEMLAAAALMGIARTLTGRGDDEVLAALIKFDRAQKRGKRG